MWWMTECKGGLWLVYWLFPNDHQRPWKNSWWPGLPVDLRDQVSAAAHNAIGNLEQTWKCAAPPPPSPPLPTSILFLFFCSKNKVVTNETPDLSFSIHPASLCAHHADQVGGGLEPLPACIGREAGCTLDGTPVYHITQIWLKNLSELNGIMILSTLVHANEEKCRSCQLACLPSYIN